MIDHPATVTVPPPILIHVHIPKTAGTTINALLGAAVQGRHFVYSRSGQPEALAAMAQPERDRIDLIFGHFPHGLHRLFTRPVRYIASVRKPPQRILSFYHYLLATEDHPKHAFVKSNTTDFSTFLRLAAKEPRVRSEIDNVQVRMIAGKMDLRDSYEETLSVALNNISEGNFFITDMERVGEFLAWLGDVMGLKFGAIPKLNASTKCISFEEEIQQLEPDCHPILERFSRWDALLCAAVREAAPGDLSRLLRSPAAKAAATATNHEAVPVSPTAAGDILIRDVVSAFYRVLLFRDPDQTGMASRVRQIRGGRSIEDVMCQILRSPEFAAKHAEFIQRYLPQAASVQFGPDAARPAVDKGAS